MELQLVLAALLMSLAAAALQRRIRRVRAETTVHHVVDAAVAHRAFNGNPQGLKNRPSGMFPVAAATGHGGTRNENVTSVKYGPHWRALRCNLTAESLHPSRIASLGPLQQDATQALVVDLSALVQDAGGEAVVEVRGHVRSAVYALAARQCFGDGLDPTLLRAMELAIRELAAGIGELNPVYDGTWLTQLVYRRPLRHLLGFLERQTKLYIPLIEARREIVRQTSGDDRDVRPYVDSLLDARVPNAGGVGGGRRDLRNDELVVLVAEFVGATYGSAVACLEWTLAHLVMQPEVQKKLRREIDDGGELSVKTLRGMPYLNAVVLESLRMYPPVPILLRSAHGKAAKAVGATTVPADGLRVMFDLGAIGRDSKVWTNPNEFRPERFLPGGEAEDVGPTPGRKEIRMMPFGAAHRVCPGITMGMMHIKWFLAALVREFEWAPSPEDRTGGVDLTEHNGFFKVMKKPLSARLTRRAKP
ncbi:unnamed protein product [Alopecurus aequalis]